MERQAFHKVKHKALRLPYAVEGGSLRSHLAISGQERNPYTEEGCRKERSLLCAIRHAESEPRRRTDREKQEGRKSEGKRENQTAVAGKNQKQKQYTGREEKKRNSTQSEKAKTKTVHRASAQPGVRKTRQSAGEGSGSLKPPPML